MGDYFPLFVDKRESYLNHTNIPQLDGNISILSVNSDSSVSMCCDTELMYDNNRQ